VLLYALFNVSFTVLSVPIGLLGDKVGRRAIGAYGFVTALVYLPASTAGMTNGPRGAPWSRREDRA
jgi:MFS family permease